MLSACAARAEYFHDDILIAYLDGNVLFDLGHYLDAGEAGVSSALGVERGNAHQSVYAVLGLQESVCVESLNVDRSALYSGFFTVQDIQDFGLESVAVSPLHIHSQQHGNPVLRLGSAGAGMERENRIGAVVFACHEGGKLLLLKLGLYLLSEFLYLVNGALVVLLLGKLDHGENVVMIGLEAVEVLYRVLVLSDLLLDCLSLLGIVPEIRLGGFHLQFIDLDLKSVKVQCAPELLYLRCERFHRKSCFIVLYHSISCIN